MSLLVAKTQNITITTTVIIIVITIIIMDTSSRIFDYGEETLHRVLLLRGPVHQEGKAAMFPILHSGV
jgi:hypothetical protein